MDTLNFERLKEHKQHGEKILPIALYHVEHKSVGNILPHHWHEEMEFLYLSTGQAIFNIDEETFLVHSGECLFINSGTVHSGFSQTAHAEYYSVVFSTELLTNPFDACRIFFDSIITNKYKLLTHFNPEITLQEKVINELKVIIDELLNKNIAYELVLKSKLFSIFNILFREKLYISLDKNQKHTLRSKKYDTLKKILGYIYMNSNRKIKITDIGEFVNLTPQYLCMFFKEMTKTSIVDFINHYRIEAATNLLKVSDLYITDIALECGFDNPSYFNRVFKKQIGCTPSEFRSNS